MASQNYQRLPVETFGRKLLLTGDLDPLYLALRRVEFDPGQMNRWLLAYWCCYHAGVACALSERVGQGFWATLLDVAENVSCRNTADQRWPRGSERRHWRGRQAIASAEDLMARAGSGPPEDLINSLIPLLDTTAGRIAFARVAARVREWRGFGPWISFKVCDMLERILDVPIDFGEADIFMFDDPIKGARLVYGANHDEPAQTDLEAIRWSVPYLQRVFHDFTAPPTFDRPLGLQEVETILCKWKSHMNGHYPVNNDIHEIREGLVTWAPHYRAASRLLAAMPDGKVLETYRPLLRPEELSL